MLPIFTAKIYSLYYISYRFEDTDRVNIRIHFNALSPYLRDDIAKVPYYLREKFLRV